MKRKISLEIEELTLTDYNTEQLYINTERCVLCMHQEISMYNCISYSRVYYIFNACHFQFRPDLYIH